MNIVATESPPGTEREAPSVFHVSNSLHYYLLGFILYYIIHS